MADKLKILHTTPVGCYTTVMTSVQYLQSKLLADAGINHGWFMRSGGVSEGSYASLNGKKGMADSDKNVDENRWRARAALLGEEKVSYAHIIHNFKTNILTAGAAGEFQDFDASITVQKDTLLSQTTADCGTVIISDTQGSVVALVHGSWHTLKEKIICKTIAVLKQYTSEELIAGIGPMACKNCYEFGSEAATLFDQKYLAEKDGKYLVDLKQMIYDQLAEMNVTQIDDLDICTIEDDRFFSARRNGAQSGRFLTLAMKST